MQKIIALFALFMCLALPLGESQARAHHRPTPKTLWPALRSQFVLADYEHRPNVQNYIKWYQKHRITLQRRIAKAGPYLNYVYQAVTARQLPTELALLPFIESGYDPYAYSTEGAAGLWQLMPRTGKVLGVKHTWWYEGRRDLEASTGAALTYFERLNKAFGDDWLLTFAAYDSGRGTVHRAIRKNRKAGKGTDFWSLPLPRETQHYIPKLLALTAIVKYPEKYGIHLPPIQRAPLLAEVNVPLQLDLIHIANMANTPLKTLQHYNPGYTRWATDPNRKNHILLPVNQVDAFKTRLANLPKSSEIVWRHHIVETGDSLILLAKRYSTTVNLLKQVNQLVDHNIKVGAFLLIPENASKLLKQSFREPTQGVLSSTGTTHRVLHEVQPGENLWTIAKRYHLPPGKLQKWNEVSDPKRIHPGDTIILWSKTAFTRDLKGVLQHEILTRYVTQPGDTLSFIAFYFDSTPQDIRQANGLITDTLTPGQTLIIPAGTLSLKHPPKKKRWQKIYYQVKPGESLYTIGQKFHVTSQDIASWNHLTNVALLKPGTRLLLYPS